MANNEVVLYSNGIAVINTNYLVEGDKPLTLNIPVRYEDLDEVLSSLTIYGANISIVSPPKYNPKYQAQSDQGGLNLKVSNVDSAILRHFVGAKITLNGSATICEILGVNIENDVVEKVAVQTWSLTVKSNNGEISTYKKIHIRSYQFVEPHVQALFTKLVDEYSKSINPLTTNLDFTVKSSTPEKPIEFSVGYTIPVAAFKVKYNLETKGDKALLTASAIVDNDTEANWDDVTITVVQGNPTSFSTDLSEVTRPDRVRINTVDEKALGNINAMSPVDYSNAKNVSNATISARSASPLRSMSLGGNQKAIMAFSQQSMGAPEYYDGVLESASDSAPSGFNLATFDEATQEEAGSHILYKSQNKTSIKSSQSSVVPLFTKEIDNNKLVLLYNAVKNKSVIYRGVRFKTPISLAKGVCQIYQDSVYQGKAILKSTNSGKEVFLLFAAENSVKVNCKSEVKVTNQTYLLNFKKSLVTHGLITQTVTNYSVNNESGNSFEIHIEHMKNSALQGLVGNYKVEVNTSSEKDVSKYEIPNGTKLVLQLEPNSVTTLTVTETTVTKQEVIVSKSNRGNLNSYIQHFLSNPLFDSSKAPALVSVLKEYDSNNQQIELNAKELEKAEGEFERALQMSEKATGARKDKIDAEVDDANSKIKQLTNDSSTLTKQQKLLEDKIYEEFDRLDLTFEYRTVQSV